MPGNAFISLIAEAGGTPISGESLETGHEKWIEISDWDWEISTESSATKGQGSSVGKPTTEGLNFTHFYDLSSTVLMRRIIQGLTFHTVKLDMCKQTGTGTPQVFLQIIMRDVFITKVGTSASEDGNVTQTVSMTFKKVGMAYKKQKDDGKLDSSTLSARWNVPEQSNEATDVSFSI